MVDQHLGCPSWPNCDESPNGCIVRMGKDDVEWYGHKSSNDEDEYSDETYSTGPDIYSSKIIASSTEVHITCLKKGD